MSESMCPHDHVPQSDCVWCQIANVILNKSYGNGLREKVREAVQMAEEQLRKDDAEVERLRKELQEMRAQLVAGEAVAFSQLEAQKNCTRAAEEVVDELRREIDDYQRVIQNEASAVGLAPSGHAATDIFDLIAAREAAAYQRGAEEMRERCAAEASSYGKAHGFIIISAEIAGCIRALPIVEPAVEAKEERRVM